MSIEETIKYIQENDPFFKDAHLDNCSDYELMLIKRSIDIEKLKQADNRPIEQVGFFSTYKE
ncbi:MAG TPA: hypothetical protein VII99_15820 [Bacteroidia bacterium]